MSVDLDIGLPQAPQAEAGLPDASGGGTSATHAPLKPGTRLGEFVVRGVISRSDMAFLYRVGNTTLNRPTVLKEYMPRALARRAADGRSLELRAARFEEVFQAGLKAYLEEAKVLERSRHPALIQGIRHWHANRTAYFVMAEYIGVPLVEALGAMHEPPTELWLRRVLIPILDALDVIHGEGLLHLAISPENVLIRSDGTPLLLHFGIPKRIAGGPEPRLSECPTPGYSALELYPSHASLPRGPWTDIYAVAALAYRAMTGRDPPDALERSRRETLIAPGQGYRGRYGRQFIQAIEAALSIQPERRMETAAQLRAALQTSVLHAAPARTPQPPAGNARWQALPRYWKQAAIAASAAALLAGVAGAYFGHKTGVPPDLQAPREDLPSLAPSTGLRAMALGRTVSWPVEVTVDEPQVVIGRDALRFRVRSAHAGYLYIFMVRTDGQHLVELFPNARDRDNHIEAGVDIALPRSTWKLVSGGPPGTDRLLALVSREPRDFKPAGLQTALPFDEFDLHDLQRAYATAGSGALAGEPQCEGDSAACGDYGAAAFSVEEVPGPG